ncbi:hypothetical protein CL628_02375 [bacterium]|nr:hypothetical protein [bacterium]
MKIKVFIENEAGSDQKNLFDEKALKYIRSVTVSRNYPFPYGFVLDTTSGDGDNLDCFILTNRKLKSEEVVEVEPIGLLEQFENGTEDHNIIAVFDDEDIEFTDEIKGELTEFINGVFEHRKDMIVRVGIFFGAKEAMKLIEESQDT